MIRLNPNRVPPVGDRETVASYCSRVARQNGRTARQFCLDMGATFQGVVDGSSATLQVLSDSMGQAGAIFPGIVVQSVGPRMFDVAGEKLSRSSLRRDTLRICPLCVAEDVRRHGSRWLAPAHVRVEWLVRAIRSCPTHEVALVALPKSDTPQTLHDSAATLADALPDLPRLVEGAEGMRTSPFEAHVLARLSGEDGGGWLSTLPLYADIAFCEVLGAVLEHGPEVELSSLTNGDRRAAALIGFRRASEGPPGIRSALSKIVNAKPPALRDVGPKTGFGRLYDWLAHETEDSAYDPVRDVVREHAVETMPLGPEDSVFGMPVDRRRVHSVRSASLEIKAHPKRLRKLLRSAGLLGEVDGVPDDRALFPVGAAAGFLSRIGGAMTLKEAAEYLAVPRPHDRLLLEAGLLKPLLPGGYRAGVDHAFAREDLDEFLASLTRDARHHPPEKASSLRDIRRTMKACNCSAPEVVGLIMDRRLPTVGIEPEARGYMSVLIDPAEVLPLVRGAAVDGLTMREVERRLSLPSHVVKALVEVGAITSFVAHNPVKRCKQTFVRVDGVARFREAYVTLGEVSRTLNVGTRRAMLDLEDGQVEPVFSKETRSYLFRRADFDEFMSRRLWTPT